MTADVLDADAAAVEYARTTRRIAVSIVVALFGMTLALWATFDIGHRVGHNDGWDDAWETINIEHRPPAPLNLDPTP